MPGFEHPVSAQVAKRLAAAADGFRNGTPMYFVSAFQALGAIERFEGEEGRIAAERARRAREAGGDGTPYGVFGPYLTAPAPGAGAGEGPEVVDVTLRVRLPDGTVRTEVLDGTGVDAVFWTRSAVDKFVLPYYVGALGLEYATRISAEFSEPDVIILAHLPDSRLTSIRLTDPGAAAT